MTSNNELTREREEFKNLPAQDWADIRRSVYQVELANKTLEDALIYLIDAEIERQGVTELGIDQAIYCLQGMKRTVYKSTAYGLYWHIMELMAVEGDGLKGVYERAINLAIQALQAYRPVEVTDKDVAFAIEELEEVNNSLKLSRDGQKELGDEKEVSGFDDWIFANELAIKVLKAYRPEREPCNWCEAPIQNTTGYIQYGCHRLDASCWNFCPVCGRKLGKVVPV